MSDSQQSDAPPDELTAAIEENPEAVATFVRRLDAVNEFLEVAELGTAAMDDEMVAELSSTGATLAESADSLATEETVHLAAAVGENGESLADALEGLARLQRSGALDDLIELADVASLETAAMDDEMVASLARTGSSAAELADTATEPETRRGLQRLLAAVGEAEATETRPIGLREIWRAVRDDGVRSGVSYLVAVARALGRGR